MKNLKCIFATAVFSVAMAVTAFAGQWNQDTSGSRYQNDDGSYAANGWHWIDRNGDAIAEGYYFDSNGYCLINTTTPDGYTVDANGAWVVNNVIQTQVIPTLQASSVQTPETAAATSEVTDSVWLSATGAKYHKISNCGTMNPDKARQLSLDEAISGGYDACKKCY